MVQDAMGPDNKGDQRVARLLDIKWVDSLSAFFGSDFLRSPILKSLSLFSFSSFLLSFGS